MQRGPPATEQVPSEGVIKPITELPALHPAGPTPHMHDDKEPILIGNESGIDDPMMVLSDGRSRGGWVAQPRARRVAG